MLGGLASFIQLRKVGLQLWKGHGISRERLLVLGAFAVYLRQLIDPDPCFIAGISSRSSSLEFDHPVEVGSKLLGILHHSGDVIPDHWLQSVRAMGSTVHTCLGCVGVVDLGPGTAVIVVDVFRIRLPDCVGAHPPSTLAAASDATREHPGPVVILRELHIILDGLSGQIDPLPRDARVGHRHSYPLLFRPWRYLRALLVALAVRTVYRLLVCLRPAPVEPPDAIVLLGIEPRGNLSRHLPLCYQLLDLLARVRPVSIVSYRLPYKELSPNLLAFGSWQSLALEGAFHSTDSGAFSTHHAKDTLYDGHSLLVYLVAVPGGVVLETVMRALGCYDLPLPGLPELPPSAPFG